MVVHKSLLVLSLCVAATSVVAQQGYIQNVPDIVQPAAKPAWAPQGWNPHHNCAPSAAANIIQYWNGNGYAGVAGGFNGKGLAGEVGWFMDTNDQTAPDDQHLGTWTNDPMASRFDVMNGIVNWAKWSATNFSFGANNLPHPTNGAPGGKVAYNWGTTLVNQAVSAFSNVVTEIDAGRPLLSSFTHWDLLPALNLDGTQKTVQLVGGQLIKVYRFNPNPAQQQSGKDEDDNYWDQSFRLGHMVTTVGYVKNFQWQPGLLGDLLLVHDTVPSLGNQVPPGFTTPTDVAIDFSGALQANLWREHVNVNPVPEPFMFLFGAAGLGLAISRRRNARRDRW